ncbi:MAG: sucrase ferredoxin [Frankiales bacterium]|nr:sucrase ferredoxin [Frankiales bacterium]
MSWGPPSDGPSRCSVLARQLDEPLPGTAPRARAWLVLEQPGPYGFRAVTESHLPAPLQHSLGTLPKDAGTTVLLARPVGRHADDHVPVEGRRFWLAHTSPGGVRMRAGRLDDAELTRPDLHDVLIGAADGRLPPWGSRSTDPLLLVCTNARRDVCCAIEGRPVADALAADPRRAGSVLEVSHLGGHRFAPTALLLPTGHSFGRFDARAAGDILDAAGRGELGALAHHRGRTALAQPAQAAEHAVRAQAHVTEIDALDVLRRSGEQVVPIALRWGGTDGVADVEVRHRDGRAWRVVVRRRTLTPPRPESCGKAPADGHAWVADELEPVRPWR